MHRVRLVDLVLKVPLVLLHELGMTGSQGITGVRQEEFIRLTQIQLLCHCQASGCSEKCPKNT